MVVGANILEICSSCPHGVGANILEVFLAVRMVVGANILEVFVSCLHGGRGEHFGHFCWLKTNFSRTHCCKYSLSHTIGLSKYTSF